MTTAPRPRRFRFSLRTIFAIELLVGAIALVVIYEAQWMLDRRRALRDGMVQMGGETIRGPFPLWLCGETGRTAMMVGVKQASDVERIRSLFPETEFFEFYQHEPVPAPAIGRE